MHSCTVQISGIRVRNLDNVSVEFEPREIVLFTGLSGSGKTSLAFDTIHALGLHRYVSTIPSFLAQAFADVPIPSIEACVGLSPTIAVRQNYFSYNPRTTVGACTQISHYLSLLFALDGKIYDPNTQTSLQVINKEYIITYLLTLPDKTKLTFLAPVKQNDPTNIQKYIQDGFTKIRVDGQILPIYSFMTSGISQQSDTYIVIDTLIKNNANLARLKVSLFTALDLGNGHCSIIIDDQEQTFSTHAYNSETKQTFTPLTFQDFSPYGFRTRCYTCQGSGLLQTITSPSIIDPQLSVLENSYRLTKSMQSVAYKELYQSFARHFQFDIHTPWGELSKEIQDAFLYSKEHLLLPIYVFDPSTSKKSTSYKIWRGILNEIGEKARYAAHPKKYIPQGISSQICPKCKGTGIKDLALSTTWQNKHYDEFQNMSLSHIYEILNGITPSPIVQDVVQTLLFRLSILIDLGLSYLTPSRSLATLSGGEQERIALAKHIGSNLKGITYILDEPSIGLHPKDIHKLTQVILKLRDQGNTVLIVEHENSMLSIADRVIDIGPEAGIFGGKIQFNGSPKKFIEESHSLTAQYLRQEKTLKLPPKNASPKSFLSLNNANIHNLKNISISFPLERITAVTGVSGSGKSSLINEWLVPQVEKYLETNQSQYIHITNNHLFHLVHISRELPPKTQRSIPLTYLKAFDTLRQLFADLPKSKQLGFNKAHFSFNLPLGACIECKGLGVVPTDNLTHISCPACQGQRFQKQILSVQYKGKTISNILDMTAQEGSLFFQDQKKLYEPIQALCSLGLHYLPLGRPLFSLSGGEIQRLKLTYEFLHPRKQSTLYVLDEPSIGLHTHDLQPLINIFSFLVQHKHTIVIIEHNMHLVQIADHIIELGPEGGDLGGHLLACCPIDQFIKKNTHTAQALRPYIEKTVPLPSIKTLPIPKPTYAIDIYDAHHFHLKHITLSMPNYSLSVVTGPSASGKHTLLFDVLYAYGNITYTEILPPYLRQILIKKTPTPKVKTIQGLPPVIAIRNLSKPIQSRLNLAHALNIASQLESLFATYGQPHAPDTGEALIKSTPENISRYLLIHHDQMYATFTVPIPPYENIKSFIQEKLRAGFLKIFANNTFYDLEDDLPSPLHNPALVIQHIRITEKNEDRLQSALSLSFSLAQQIQVLIHTKNAIHTYLFSNGWLDSRGKNYPHITKNIFSPYTEEGRCPICQGSGECIKIALQQHYQLILSYTPQQLFQTFCPVASLVPLHLLLNKLNLSKQKTLASLSKDALTNLLAKLEPLLQQYVQFPILHPDLQNLVTIQPCSDCLGTGIHSQTNDIRIQGLSIIDIYTKDIAFVQKFLTDFASSNMLPAIQSTLTKLSYLKKVGISYVCLGQKQHTLSCGEIYRVHIVKMIAPQLTDVVYLLEDPLSGLHPHDQVIVIKLLQDLISKNNTVIASDRTQNLIPYADHTICLGPGAGPQGGYLIPKQEKLPLGTLNNKPTKSDITHKLHIDFSAHYCQNMKVIIPLQSLTTIIGISGAGKTTLLKEGIYKQALQMINQDFAPFSNIVVVDSSPLTSSNRSDIGTYFDITPTLRQFYASLSQAKALNITSSMFSPNTKQGQCPHCLGLGYCTIDRAFYALETVTCASCSGFRIQSLSQEVKYQNKHFGHILQTPIQDILNMFPFLKKIHAPIQALMDMGLEYLQLGQPFSSLSTSEKTSIKIVKQLRKPFKSPTLFLLDEMVSSLDQSKKIAVYNLYCKLINEGHSIVQVDNDLQFINCADYLIELGPGAGKYGGQITFSGDPQTYHQSL